MKRTFPFIVMTLAITTLVFFASCKKNSTPPSLADQINDKWYMQQAVSGGGGNSQRDTTNFTGADYFDFKADGTLDISANEGTSYPGKWSISGTKLIISETGYLDNSKGWDMPILTKTNLQL